MTAALGRRLPSALRRCTLAAALLAALACYSELLAQSHVDSRTYKLAPGDRITVMVFGQVELSGDFVVDGAGNVLLPFIGPVEVKDRTILECQQLIHDRLADGILNQPSVSVRVSELRPLYVLGDVRAPGAYPYRFGSTAKSAVALAGGFGVGQLTQSAALSEFLVADERMRQLGFQRLGLVVRRARIEAQLDGASEFSPPSSLSGFEGADVAEVVAIEKRTFDSQAIMLRNQLDLLRSQKPRIQSEIDALEAQITTSKKQLELVKQHADQYSRLVKQGLGLANSELQFKLTQAAHESELWRLTAQVSRLQMDLGDLDVKIHEAEASFKRQLIIELRDARERLRELDVTLPSAREIRGVKARQAGGPLEVERSINVTRTRNGETAVFQAADATPLEPGDIIEVKLLPESSPMSGGKPGLDPFRMGAAAPERPLGPTHR
jgi:polysaccharide export outer membrane protein